MAVTHLLTFSFFSQVPPTRQKEKEKRTRQLALLRASHDRPRRLSPLWNGPSYPGGDGPMRTCAFLANKTPARSPGDTSRDRLHGSGQRAAGRFRVASQDRPHPVPHEASHFLAFNLCNPPSTNLREDRPLLGCTQTCRLLMQCPHPLIPGVGPVAPRPRGRGS